MTIIGLTNETVSGKLKLQAAVKSPSGDSFGKYIYLLDGRIVGKSKIVDMDTSKIKNGEHTLRVVAFRTGSVRSQVFVEKKIIVANTQNVVARDQPSPAAETLTNKPAAKKVEINEPAVAAKTIPQSQTTTPASEDKKVLDEHVAPSDGGMGLEGAGRR